MALSVCMIVKNEGKALASCLASVKEIANEIVIVDTGSTDNTKEIAKKFGAKIFDYQWTDDFSSARNFSLSKATKEWILVIDADELLEPQDSQGIMRLISMPRYDAFSLIQRTYVNDSNLFSTRMKIPRYGFSSYFDVEVVRLFKNNNGYKYEGQVHELVDKSLKDASIARSDVVLHHIEHLKGEEAVKQKQIRYLEILKKELLKNPDEEKLLCDAALITFHFLDDFEEAKKYLETALKAHPKSTRAMMLFGQMFANRGNADEAIKWYEKVEPTKVVYQNLAALYSAKGDNEKAKSYAEKSKKLQTAPGNVPIP